MTGHRLYWLSLTTGKRELLWHMTDGIIGDPPSISTDGKRVVFYVWHPGPAENSHFTGTTNAIYSLDIDPATGKASGPLRMVTVYAGRKGPDYGKNKSDQTLINHCQVNPKYPDRIGYAHQYNGSVSNGSWERARIWATYVDGRDEGPLLITPAGRWHTHEVWGPMGDWIYFVDSGDIARVNASDKRVQTLAKGLNPLALHLTVSADESRIVFDTVSSWQYDKDDTRSSPLVLLDVPSGKTTTLTSLRAGRSTSATSASEPLARRAESCFRVGDGIDRPGCGRRSALMTICAHHSAMPPVPQILGHASKYGHTPMATGCRVPLAIRQNAINAPNARKSPKKRWGQRGVAVQLQNGQVNTARRRSGKGYLGISDRGKR